MSNDDWVKLHRKMDITTRILYWAQNEDMIDQYYTQRGKDLLEAAKMFVQDNYVKGVQGKELNARVYID